jgi:transposase, IS5 family
MAQHPKVAFHVAAKRGKIKAMADGPLKEALQRYEKAKAQVRALVEHPFHIIKNLFRHGKVRYRGLAKNVAQLHILFALANLFMARRHLQQAPAASA